MLFRFGGTTTPATEEPQFAQNGFPSSISAPQDRHFGAILAPQFAQNGLSLGVSPWHAWHCIVDLLGSESYDAAPITDLWALLAGGLDGKSPIVGLRRVFNDLARLVIRVDGELFVSERTHVSFNRRGGITLRGLEVTDVGPVDSG